MAVNTEHIEQFIKERRDRLETLSPETREREAFDGIQDEFAKLTRPFL